MIIYKAAAGELYDGEAEALRCDTTVIAKRNYVFVTVTDYLKDTPLIDAAFKELLKQPGIDPMGIA